MRYQTQSMILISKISAYSFQNGDEGATCSRGSDRVSPKGFAHMLLKCVILKTGNTIYIYQYSIHKMYRNQNTVLDSLKHSTVAVTMFTIKHNKNVQHQVLQTQCTSINAQ